VEKKDGKTSNIPKLKITSERDHANMNK